MYSEHERIGVALDLLTDGLAPYVEAKLREAFREDWVKRAQRSFRDNHVRVTQDGEQFHWDTHAVLMVMWDQWNALFRHDLGYHERSMVSELREFRNRWAHQQAMDFDDVWRILDSVHRLLRAVDAPNLDRIIREKDDLLEAHVAEAVNTQIQRTAFERNKWGVIGIYTACAVAISVNIIVAASPGAWAIASLTMLTLVYLIYQQFKMEPPQLFGPHECPRCRKIVYSRPCPYCEIPVVHTQEETLELAAAG